MDGWAFALNNINESYSVFGAHMQWRSTLNSELYKIWKVLTYREQFWVCEPSRSTAWDGECSPLYGNWNMWEFSGLWVGWLDIKHSMGWGTLFIIRELECICPAVLLRLLCRVCATFILYHLVLMQVCRNKKKKWTAVRFVYTFVYYMKRLHCHKPGHCKSRILWKNPYRKLTQNCAVLMWHTGYVMQCFPTCRSDTCIQYNQWSASLFSLAASTLDRTNQYKKRRRQRDTL